MKTNRAVRFVAAGIGVLTLLVRPGFGVDYVWTNTAGGDYAVSGNWNPAGPPSLADRAIFNSNSTYSIGITAPFTNASMVFQQGNVSVGPGSSFFKLTDLFIGTQTAKRASFTMNAVTAVVSNLRVGYDTVDGASGVLCLSGGSKLTVTGAASYVRIGNYNQANWVTGKVVISESTLDCDFAVAPTYVSWGGVAELYVTNGGFFQTKYMYAGKGIYKTNYPVANLIVLGGGTGTSTIITKDGAEFNYMADQYSGWNLVYPRKTTELVVLTNGLFDNRAASYFYPGSFLTLAGGTYYSHQSDIFIRGAAVRGSGKFSMSISFSANLSLRKQAGNTGWPQNINNVTNIASMGPGTSQSPIGKMEFTSWRGGLEVQPGCSLNFDLAGKNAGEYDRIEGTNMTAYLGLLASPGTGGAVINVALTNNFVPVNGDTFDVLSAANIAESDLSLVSFNWPAQPANLTWKASIITNIIPKLTNETLRLTVSGGKSHGTVFMVK